MNKGIQTSLFRTYFGSISPPFPQSLPEMGRRDGPSFFCREGDWGDRVSYGTTKKPTIWGIVSLALLLVLASCAGLTFEKTERLVSEGKPRHRIAIFHIRAEGAIAIDADRLIDRLQEELPKIERVEVLGKASHIAGRLSARGIDLEDCETTVCLAEAGKLLGADRVVTGSIRRIGDTYSVKLKVVDVHAGVVVKTVEGDYPSDRMWTALTIHHLAGELVGQGTGRRAPSRATGLGQRIAILSFANQVKHYRGAWDIQNGVARLLGETLAQNPFYVLVPADSVRAVLSRWSTRKVTSQTLKEVGQELGADILITGNIQQFDLSRFMVGSRMIGGYTSYSSTVQLEARLLRVVDGEEIGVMTGEGEVRDRDLGLTLLGKPRDRDSQFYGLDAIEFGSEKFRQTVLGQALMEALKELQRKIEGVIVPPSVPPPSQSAQPVVLLVEGGTIYVNLGWEDDVSVGDKFETYVPGKELRDPTTGAVLGRTDDNVMGVLQIVKIKAAHLSKAKAVEGTIRAHQAIRAR